MEYETIAPAFDMPGGGVQFLVNWTRLEDDSGKILSKRQANMAIQSLKPSLIVLRYSKI